MGSVDLSPFKKIIIESDQFQVFYNTLAFHTVWFETYVSWGGILEIHAAANGWNGGVWGGRYSMPDEITQTSILLENVTINLSSHPILLSPNLINDNELDDWVYSAHGYFDVYPASSKEI